MFKKFLSILLAFVLIISMSLFAFASGGFNQREYDALTTLEARGAYLDAVDKYYASKGFNVDSDEFAAYTAACSALAQEKRKAATTTASGDDATIIANIKSTYGVGFELGEAGRYEKGAKVSQHLKGMESGLSYLGSVFTKKVAKHYADKAENGRTFKLRLIPRLDTKTVSGSTQTNWGLAYGDGSQIDFFVYDSFPLKASMVVHEYGHLLESMAHGDLGVAHAPFGNKDGVTYGENGAVKSFAPDKFISAYAATNAKEDYAEVFMTTVINGGDKPIAYGKDTAVYKKTLAIYNDLMATVGADSRATQRVGAYLGLMP